MATPSDIDISLSGPERPEITSSGAEMDETSFNKPEANTKNQRRGCMECTDKSIPNFSKLKGGEHLEMRGTFGIPGTCCSNKKSCYSHHAIVDEVLQDTIKNNGSKAEVQLLHIKNINGKVERSSEYLDVAVNKVRLVEYTMRTHDLKTTKVRAAAKVDETNSCCYDIRNINCEHFCSFATTSNCDIDTKLGKDGSLQVRNCWRSLVNCLCFGNRVISSTFKFFLYLSFLTSDDIIDIVPKSLAKNFADYCGSTTTSNGTLPWRHQKCHLSILGITAGLYALYVLCNTYWLVTDMLSCKRCKLKSVFSLWFRFCLYLLIEVLLIFTEHEIFNKIRNSIMNAKREKYISRSIFALAVILKSFIECIIIFWLDNFFITFLPPYWVKKTKLSNEEDVQKEIKHGDVISFKQNKYAMSVDAIVAEVLIPPDSSHINLRVLYQQRCKFWIFCCSYTFKDESVIMSREFVRVYDFSDYSHVNNRKDVITIARENASKNSWLCCCFRSSNFCYRAKVKDITCRDRFTKCEWGCKQVFCC